MTVNIDLAMRLISCGSLAEGNELISKRQTQISNLILSSFFFFIFEDPIAKNPISQSMHNDSDKIYRHLGVLLHLYLGLVEM